VIAHSDGRFPLARAAGGFYAFAAFGTVAFFGLGLSAQAETAVVEGVSTNAAPTPAADSAPAQDWNWHGQTTFIGSIHPNFSSRIPPGPNSLNDHFERQETLSLDLAGGLRIWEGGEAHLDGLLWQGYGFSKTLGIEGFPNAEAYRAGTRTPNVVFARAFIRHTFGLGGGTESVPDDMLHLAGPVDVERLTLTLGKISVLDVFDNNSYASSARTQFQNWGLTSNEAWDYPADSIGYMTGAAADLHEENWSLRYGVFQMPKVSNGLAIDKAYLRAWGMVTEVERRFTLGSRPGAVRFLTFLNRAHMGRFQTVVDDPALSIAETRNYRLKYGFGVNAEQEILPNIGVFARAGWSDGHSESWAFADVDRSLSIGAAVKGAAWGRPNDIFGVAGLFNGLSKVHQRFFEVGGTGILAGDGTLNYRVEQILETYYDATVYKTVHVGIDYQFIANPAYNGDRGPVHDITGRLHFEF
jgi:high affinity Mn2+ porin